MHNENYFKIVDHAIAHNKLSQVYLFVALPKVNFDKYLTHFINKINKESFEKFRDIPMGELYFLVDGYNEAIAKDEILEAVKNVSTSQLNVNNLKKILIIKNIENGSQKTLNALLKFLENPPKDCIIFITTNAQNKVLKTIKSRAFIIDIKREFDLQLSGSKYDNFFARISENDEFLTSQMTEENFALYDELIAKLSNARKDPHAFLSYLDATIDEKNAYMLALLLDFIFHEIFSYQNYAKSSFVLLDKKTAFNYQDFETTISVLMIIHEFKKSLASNANYVLAKANFIAKLGEAYGV
ncbi:DNA polymerase III subunit delta [Metamycoplasma arthritidis]|uniref:DNA polymerase III subunit delta n=1 Tax=Metamycoplasma arthritidis (strain 158L3-1) TaxID=243272 RepID=B3PM38_META1|nr:DNA polymerase III subunit delta [Metamycoplasma arthritidis]ACF07090.1 DNA polymerase III subunit delta [Metamycoplasma arthritidis 158L3-1]VEU78618.1 DNA polymerase III subunit delta [Metamycoplasma arthritidis]